LEILSSDFVSLVIKDTDIRADQKSSWKGPTG
jgi:hypothetical protein